MKFTDEQQAAIESNENIKVNACAGSGKTTFLMGYSQARPNERKLYLCFNKANQIEAEKRAKQLRLTKLQVMTAHGLAYRHLGVGKKYKVRNSNIKSYELWERHNLSDTSEDFSICRLALDLFSHYCNSSYVQIIDIPMVEFIVGKKSFHIDLIRRKFSDIQKIATTLWLDMEQGLCDINHEFYLKKYQLMKPQVKVDYVLYDEAQDANPVMLDIFYGQQNAVKVLVGDEHQSIYGWRRAVNALSSNTFKTYHLTRSFRFPQTVAHYANNILEIKEKLFGNTIPRITGLGPVLNKFSQTCYIGRSNIDLLSAAIELFIISRNVRPYYFELDFNSMFFSSDGVSLFDVYYLWKNDKSKIQGSLLRKFKTFDDFLQYADDTNDLELQGFVNLLKIYGSKIISYIYFIRDNQVRDKSKAEYVFTTAHKSKGLEFDRIKLLGNFISDLSLAESYFTKKYPSGSEFQYEFNGTDRFDEELNLLYVAITRSKTFLDDDFVIKNYLDSLSWDALKERFEGIHKSFDYLKETNQKPVFQSSMLLKGFPMSGGDIYIPEWNGIPDTESLIYSEKIKLGLDKLDGGRR